MRSLFFILTFSLALSTHSFGQDPIIMEEDFANGIPEDWTNQDLSNIGLLWTYCADTTAYGTIEEPNCPFDFTNGDNRQSHFNSITPDNGFACCVTEPFLGDLGSTEFDSRLTTSAIDCSDRNEVYLTFRSHIGVFNVDASENALVRVSTDAINWTTYFPFPNLISGQNTQIGCERWSFNPEEIMFDISEIAANEETVYIQWYWQGRREYHWSIDDVIVTTENPFPLVDVSLRPVCQFHSLMSNFDTPISQIDTAFFLTDAAQIGLETLDNVEVVARVTNVDNGDIIYEENNIVEALLPNQNNFDLVFPPYFHEAGIGNFMLTYTIDNLEEDTNLGNSLFEYPFRISDNTFQKHQETDINFDLLPLNLNEEGLIIPNWAIGNYFHVPNGQGFFVDEIFFEVPNRSDLREISPDGELIEYFVNDPGIVIDIKLYKWDNVNQDDFATDNEYQEIGFGTFTIQGGDGTKINKIKIQNFFGEGNIPLEDNQDYFIVLEYPRDSPFNELFAVRASTHLNYDAMIHANDWQDKLRFAAMNKIGNTSTFNTFAFGGEVVPHIGFNITDISTSTSETLVSNAIQLSPNPSDKLVNISLDFPVEKNGVITLLSLQSQHIKSYAVNQKNMEIDCSELANGTYLIQYKSDTSIALKKLVVLH